MKRIWILAILSGILAVAAVHIAVFTLEESGGVDKIKVGYIYVGDACNAYTKNFMHAQDAILLEYGDRVENIPKYNVSEGSEEKILQELIAEGCDLIFGTSYGYGPTFRKYAELYPEVEFCMATGDNANDGGVLPNYHCFMGEIYEGRYISGVVAGMKLLELIENGEITEDEAVVGYVAAYPYAEVISGYTAFYLGIASVVPEVSMLVSYSDSWGDYSTEYEIAEKLIDMGCVIISQHSDTAGPAVACEEASAEHTVFHIGYNQSMSDVAPTTSIISCRINWQKYMLSAVKAVLNGKEIESVVEGNVHGRDVSGGFKEGWLQMLKLNEVIAAPGTAEKIEELIGQFEREQVEVFRGDYTGVDPFDSTDTYDLSKGFTENEHQSSPEFHYVLQDVITIVE